MLKVGLTGGIGSGKTTIARIFETLGIPVFLADQEAKKLMESSGEIIQSIKSDFGDAAFQDGKLNRKFLAGIVFSDPLRLGKLNQLIHPAVHRHFEEWTLKFRDAPYVVEEAALLFESGAFKYFDYMVLVTAAINKRIERVMARDDVPEKDVLVRINSQMPDEEKIAMADFLIFNDDQNMLLNQVLAFHEKMISLNKK